MQSSVDAMDTDSTVTTTTTATGAGAAPTPSEYVMGERAQQLDHKLLSGRGGTCHIGAGAFGTVKRCVYADEMYARKESTRRVRDAFEHRDFVNIAYAEAALVNTIKPYRVHAVYATDENFGVGAYPREVVTVLITDYVGGEELIDVLEQPDVANDPSWILQYTTVTAAYLLKMLEDMHKLKVAHRDIKLDNVRFDAENNRPTLMDWGFACFPNDLAQTAAARPMAHACELLFRGTPSYMSPFSFYAILGTPAQIAEMRAGFSACEPQNQPMTALFRREDQWAVATSIFYALIKRMPVEVALYDDYAQKMPPKLAEVYNMGDYVWKTEEYITSFLQRGMPIPLGDPRLVGDYGYADMLSNIDPHKVAKLVYAELSTLLKEGGVDLESVATQKKHPQLKPSVTNYALVLANMLNPSGYCISNLHEFTPSVDHLAQVFSQ